MNFFTGLALCHSAVVSVLAMHLKLRLQDLFFANCSAYCYEHHATFSSQIRLRDYFIRTCPEISLKRAVLRFSET